MIFDPTPTCDDAPVLVASFSDRQRYVKPDYVATIAQRAQDERERTYGGLMHQRTGVCG